MIQNHEQLHTADAPLRGCSILVTRPLQDAQALAERVRVLGGCPIVAPLIEVVYPDSHLSFNPPFVEHSHSFDVVAVTSANGVSGWSRSGGFTKHRDLISGSKWFVVGQRTRRALEDMEVEGYLPEGCRTGEDLAVFLGQYLSTNPLQGNRLLYLRGTLASPEFCQTLSAAGWDVTECVCYDVRPALWPESAWQTFIASPPPRAVLLFSPSAVHHLAKQVPKSEAPTSWLEGTVIACVGTSTAKACEAAGLPVHAVARRPDQDALLSATAIALAEAAV